MSLTEQITALATRVGQEIKSVRAAKADDTAVVHTTGAETISGVKTFGSAPVVPTGSATGNPVRRDDARLTDDRNPTPHSHSASDVSSGTLALARLPVGSTSSTVARGDRVQALEDEAPLDGGVCTKRMASNQTITANTNAVLALATAAASTQHVQVNSATMITILTSGLYDVDAGMVMDSGTVVAPTLWIGSPDFVTARYCQAGGIQAAANAFPAVDCSASVYLTAGTQLCACVYLQGAAGSVQRVGASYGLSHLTAALIRRG